MQELYQQYLQVAQAAIGVGSSQNLLNDSFSLSIVRVESLNDRLREMINLFLQAKGFSGGSFNASTPYTPNIAFGDNGNVEQPGALSTYVNPYTSYVPNWTFGRGFEEVIDVTPIQDAAGAVNDVADAMGNAGTATNRMSQDWKQYVDRTRAANSESKGMLGTLNQYINWYLRWTLVSEAFQAMVSSIKNAI